MLRAPTPIHVRTQPHCLFSTHVASSFQIKSSVNRKNAKYVLKGEAANNIFKVNPDTGDVFAFARLDREKVSSYPLVALIVDKDTDKDLESPSSFTIKVHDINDNWPVFTQQLFNASVLEMSPGGTCPSCPSPPLSLIPSLEVALTLVISVPEVRSQQVQRSGYSARAATL